MAGRALIHSRISTASPAIPIIGRATELLVVERLLSRLSDGAQVLLVTGGTGVGKTRLVEHLLAVLTPAATSNGVRARRPVVAVHEDLDLACDDTLADLSRKLDSPNAATGLTVLTARLPRAAGPSLVELWARHEARPSTTSLHLRSLPDAAVETLARHLLPTSPDAAWRDVVQAAAGLPGRVVDLCRWHTDRSAARPDPAEFPYLQHELALVERDGVLTGLAVVGAPTTARTLAQVAGIEPARVKAVLDLAVHRRVAVACSGWEPTFDLSHDGYRQLLVRAADEGLLRRVQRQVADLVAENTGPGPSAAAAGLAVRYRAAGAEPDLVARQHLHAARWFERRMQFVTATEHAVAGLELAEAPAARARLLLLKARLLARTGDRIKAAAVAERAVQEAGEANDPTEFVAATVEVLAIGCWPSSPAARSELVTTALARCPPHAGALRARLLLRHALEQQASPGPAFPAAARAALVAAEAVGSPDLLSETVCRVAECAPPSLMPDLERTSSRVRRGPAPSCLGSLAGLAVTALTSGRRDRLEATWAEFTAVESRYPDPATRRTLRQIALARAVLDLDTGTAAAEVAALESSGSALPMRSLVRLAEAAQVGDVLRADPDSLARSGSGEADALLQALADLSRTGSDPVDPQWSGPATSLPPPAEVPRTALWTAWMSLHARLAVATGNLEACEQVVDALRPYARTFAVLPALVPLAPIGWLLAEPLNLLGRPVQARAASDHALAVSRSLRAPGWQVQCLLQRGRLLPAANRLEAVAAVAEARSSARTHGLRSLVTQAEHLMGTLLEAGGDAAGDSLEPPGPGIGPGVNELLAHLSAGMTNAEIARASFCSVATVERRLGRLYRRFGVRNRAQLVARLTHTADPPV